MAITYKVLKKADKQMNRIIIPKFIIDRYGRDFYLEYHDDETIRLIPVKKGE